MRSGAPGPAEACYEWTRAYINERKAFGSTLSKLQTIQHKMAEMKTEIVVGRNFADNCLKHVQKQQNNNNNLTGGVLGSWRR